MSIMKNMRYVWVVNELCKLFLKRDKMHPRLTSYVNREIQGLLLMLK